MKVLTSKLKFNRLAQCIALMRDHDDFVVNIPSGVIRDMQGATIAEFSKDTFQEVIEATTQETDGDSALEEIDTTYQKYTGLSHIPEKH